MKDKKPIIFLLVIVVAGVYYLFGSNVSDKCGNPPLMSFFQQETLSTDGIWTFCSGQDGKMQKYKYDCSQITNYEWVKNITEEKGCCFSADYPKEETKCGDENYLIVERFKCDTTKGVWVFDRWSKSGLRCGLTTTGWVEVGSVPYSGTQIFVVECVYQNGCELAVTYTGLPGDILLKDNTYYPVAVLTYNQKYKYCLMQSYTPAPDCDYLSASMQQGIVHFWINYR